MLAYTDVVTLRHHRDAELYRPTIMFHVEHGAARFEECQLNWAFASPGDPLRAGGNSGF